MEQSLLYVTKDVKKNKIKAKIKQIKERPEITTYEGEPLEAKVIEKNAEKEILRHRARRARLRLEKAKATYSEIAKAISSSKMEAARKRAHLRSAVAREKLMRDLSKRFSGNQLGQSQILSSGYFSKKNDKMNFLGKV